MKCKKGERHGLKSLTNLNNQLQIQACCQPQFQAGNQLRFEAGLTSKSLVCHQPKNKAFSLEFGLVKFRLVNLGWFDLQGGVAHGDIHLRFAWQAWHLVTFRSVW